MALGRMEATKGLLWAISRAWLRELGSRSNVEVRLSGAVYTCDDPDGLRAAMNEGADPTPYLTLVQMCAFPAGTDEVVLEMSVACGGLIE